MIWWFVFWLWWAFNCIIIIWWGPSRSFSIHMSIEQSVWVSWLWNSHPLSSSISNTTAKKQITSRLWTIFLIQLYLKLRTRIRSLKKQNKTKRNHAIRITLFVFHCLLYSNHFNWIKQFLIVNHTRPMSSSW